MLKFCFCSHDDVFERLTSVTVLSSFLPMGNLQKWTRALIRNSRRCPSCREQVRTRYDRRPRLRTGMIPTCKHTRVWIWTTTGTSPQHITIRVSRKGRYEKGYLKLRLVIYITGYLRSDPGKPSIGRTREMSVLWKQLNMLLMPPPGRGGGWKKKGKKQFRKKRRQHT